VKQHREKGYLFEVSWEVCNKVGGIYTVITSKLREAAHVYKDRYILLGPDLKTNIDFEETDEDCWTKIREVTAIKEIPCRFGRWKIPETDKDNLGFTGNFPPPEAARCLPPMPPF